MKYNLVCPKCGKSMKEAPSGCDGSITVDEKIGAVVVKKYICIGCGYIEQYAKIKKDKSNECPEDEQDDNEELVFW